ncbi:ketopantoate reductase C-terminal domain-containing protein [Mucilaginibacter sp. PAMB04274]|uniref:ketopantoate reductase family protein n=1 Tax=Mucilaginibacter sp. PAMB04274 TaxID=3138568 RepID=UPI0031F606FB
MAGRIHIVGSGAIGKALAVCLLNAGKDAVLVRTSVDGEPDKTETIRLNLPYNGRLFANVTIKTFSSLDMAHGIFIVCSKSFVNEMIALKLTNFALNAPVILLQNGLNVERAFVNKGFTQLYRCVLMVTSQFEGESELRFRPVAACPIGIVAGNEDLSAHMVEHLHTSWFPFRCEDQINKFVWQKVIINCIFNSICPLLETDNGVFHREPAAMQIADRIIKECVDVSVHSGIELNIKDVRAAFLLVSRAADGQIISTLQDIRNKRPTEMESLNLEVAAIAHSGGLENKVNITRTLGELTALKSILNR